MHTQREIRSTLTQSVIEGEILIRLRVVVLKAECLRLLARQKIEFYAHGSDNVL